MRTIVIYNSQTGFTKRYAEWIAQAAGADCAELSAAKKLDLAPYEAIVFGGWAFAGRISKINWFKRHIAKWTDKKLLVFCVGASPAENPEIEPTLKRIFNKPEQKRVNVFYCPGGFSYEKMSAPSKLLMKMFVNALKVKQDKTPEEQKMIQTLCSSYDLSDRTYIEPILACLKG